MADAQWVLITGAARPTGLGYWTAKRLIADSSASVILSAKTQAAADEAAARLVKETGRPEHVAALGLDVTDRASIEAAATAVERDFAGRLVGLINNAATWSMTTGREEYDRVWAIDVRGTFDVGRRFAPLINHGGHIVNVGSHTGRLDSIPLPRFRDAVRGAASIQDLIDIPCPADEISEVAPPEMGLLYFMSKAAVLHGTRLQTHDDNTWAKRTPEQGARAIAWAFTSPKARGSKGGFFQDNRPLDIVSAHPDGWGLPDWVEE